LGTAFAVRAHPQSATTSQMTWSVTVRVTRKTSSRIDPKRGRVFPSPPELLTLRTWTLPSCPYSMKNWKCAVHSRVETYTDRCPKMRRRGTSASARDGRSRYCDFIFEHGENHIAVTRR